MYKVSKRRACSRVSLFAGRPSWIFFISPRSAPNADRHQSPAIVGQQVVEVGLDQGRIVEEGSHDALLRKGGLYADLWRRQSGGFIAREAAE